MKKPLFDEIDRELLREDTFPSAGILRLELAKKMFARAFRETPLFNILERLANLFGRTFDK